MANPLLHIKDAYYFEVPRFLWKSQRQDRSDFPPHYIRLDPDYQDWEAARQYEGLAQLEGVAAPLRAAPERLDRPFRK